MRSLIAVLAVLLAACTTAAPGATPAPTAVPTVAVTPAPVTPAPATPPPTVGPAITPGPTYPCDPAYYDCEPKYTPRPTPAGATPEPVGDQLVIDLSPDGGFLVDEASMSLYVFDRDSELVSDCTSSDCLNNWPPVILPPEVAAVGGEGVTGDLVGFERSDGATQVAYNGRPLYYFAGDSAPGDTNGDGVGGVWHLATP